MNAIEQQICEAVVDALLAYQYDVRVNDGESYCTPWTTDRAIILSAMYSTGEDVLYARKTRNDVNTPEYFVQLIYGNGCDVVSDCSCALEAALFSVSVLADTLSEGE